MIPQTITNFRQIPTDPNVEQKQIMMIWDPLVGASTYTQFRNGEEWYPNCGGSFEYEGQSVMQWFDSDIEFGVPYSYEIVAYDASGTAIGKSAPVAMIQYGGNVATPFASVSDLTTYWKAPDNTTRTEYLLNLASARLRAMASPVNLDEKSANDPIFKEMLKWVVMEAVKRAVQAPTDLPPVETYSQTAGPYSENYKYSNPTGDLWFKKSELLALGISSQQRISSIQPSTSRDIYPTTEV